MKKKNIIFMGLLSSALSAGSLFAANPVPNCTVEVKAPDESQDGCPSAKFTVKIVGDDCPTPEKYEWEWRVLEKYKGTAKRIPSSFFDNAAVENPVVSKPQWYAANGLEWLSGRGPNGGDGENEQEAKYEARCIATLDGCEVESPWVEWNVYVFKTTPSLTHPVFSGKPEIKARKATDEERNGKVERTWVGYVASKGSMNRSEPILNVNGMKGTNSF